MLYFAIFFLILTVLLSYLFKILEGFDESKLIIVSRYNEKLEWLKEEPFSKYKIIIYNKGINENFYHAGEVIPMKNVGREGHTYLYYIVENYYHLPDLIIFLPGSADHPNKINKTKKMMQEIERTNKPVFVKDNLNIDEMYHFTIDRHEATSNDNKAINDDFDVTLSSIRPFGKWFEQKFGIKQPEYVSYAGIVSVSKKDVLQHPKSYYQDLLQEVSMSVTPEVGHYIERSWHTIFSMKDTIVL